MQTGDQESDSTGMGNPDLDDKWCEKLSALAHPARLEILQFLSQHDNCFCKEVVSYLPLAQSTVSQHLKVLVAAGLVDIHSEAQRSHYRLNERALLSISNAVSDLAGTCCKSDCCDSAGKWPSL